MRLSRPRLTIRRLMLLVAVLGLVLELGIVGWRWDHYRRQAERHEEIADVLRGEIRAFEQSGDDAHAVEVRRGALIEEERDARRFRAAQRRPWQGVPDESPGD